MATINDVRNRLSADTISKRNGVFTVRMGFFYSHGRTAENLVAAVKSALPTAVILDSGEVWKAFRGGASTANQSHWWVTFTWNGPAKPAVQQFDTREERNGEV